MSWPKRRGAARTTDASHEERRLIRSGHVERPEPVGVADPRVHFGARAVVGDMSSISSSTGTAGSMPDGVGVGQMARSSLDARARSSVHGAGSGSDLAACPSLVDARRAVTCRRAPRSCPRRRSAGRCPGLAGRDRVLDLERGRVDAHDVVPEQTRRSRRLLRSPGSFRMSRLRIRLNVADRLVDRGRSSSTSPLSCFTKTHESSLRQPVGTAAPGREPPPGSALSGVVASGSPRCRPGRTTHRNPLRRRRRSRLPPRRPEHDGSSGS